MSALVLGLDRLWRNEEPTVGQRLDSAVEKTEQAAADARAKPRLPWKKADARIDQSAERAEIWRRTWVNLPSRPPTPRWTKVDDATITAQVSAGLAKDPDLSAVQINVDTQNGAVTLNGPAPNLAAKDRAQTIAKSIKGVTSRDQFAGDFCRLRLPWVGAGGANMHA